MKPNKTNIQRITQYMNADSLNQAFVMEAVSRYASSVIANKDDMIKLMADTFIEGKSWVSSAESWVATEETQFRNI
jgi:hypothetical protein